MDMHLYISTIMCAAYSGRPVNMWEHNCLYIRKVNERIGNSHHVWQLKQCIYSSKFYG